MAPFSFGQTFLPPIGTAAMALTTIVLSGCDHDQTIQDTREKPAPQEPLPPAGAPPSDLPDSTTKEPPAADPWQIMAETCQKELERLRAIDQLGRSVHWRFQKIVRVSGLTSRVHVTGTFEELPAPLRDDNKIDFLIDADFLRFTRDTTHCEYENRPIVDSLRRRVQDVIDDYAASFLEKRPTASLNGLEEAIAYEANGVSIRLFVHYPDNILEGCTEKLECLSGKIPELFGAEIGTGLKILVDNDRLFKSEGLFHRQESYFIPPRSGNPSGGRESR